MLGQAAPSSDKEMDKKAKKCDEQGSGKRRRQVRTQLDQDRIIGGHALLAQQVECKVEVAVRSKTECGALAVRCHRQPELVRGLPFTKSRSEGADGAVQRQDDEV